MFLNTFDPPFRRGKMSDKLGGTFSANLFSLQLQLKTLLEDAGGESVVKLLDQLSTLNPSECKIALRIFSSVIDRILNGPERLFTQEDKNLRDFEEGLYHDIIGSMREASNELETPRIEVLNGGKSKLNVVKKPINLAEARKHRRIRLKPLLN